MYIYTVKKLNLKKNEEKNYQGGGGAQLHRKSQN